jgi:hypothetical protein
MNAPENAGGKIMNLRDAIHEDPIPAVAKQSKKARYYGNHYPVKKKFHLGNEIYSFSIAALLVFFLVAPETAQEVIAGAVNFVVSWVGF